MIYQIILLIHVFIAVCIIALVLVQQGKGATIGAAFGGGASQTVFGSRGSGSFLFRFTISLAAIFFLTSIGLNYIVARAYKQPTVLTLPAVPAKTSGAPTVPTAPSYPLPANGQQPAGTQPVDSSNKT